ncbi:TetR family transcriptional regulator [Roseibium hamelinense]|uniref:TetR family transcriptional regulator n=1 Tax=Roseibium hamelinense TaxID=150831 RepID=A0A562TKA0_9HYPH|nr:TetR/AcrR family transcriptional regulator [Roseibium hamelinense]MTI42614.1 TetR/AcrR family transcriptional regulator [Roseibium hamelinense]TWI93360.1 TetR family transcriptional regulator [Roseibium hamelinense]
MARPREFDIDEAINGAMRLFWDQGYEDASLADLLVAMKITKGSFYKAFTDKKSVYLAALDLYSETVVQPAVDALKDPGNGTGDLRILDLFEMVVSAADADGDRQGCFLCNAVVDRAAHDPEIEHKLQDMMRRLRSGFVIALSDPSLGMSEKQVQTTASGVLASYLGLRVLGKAGMSQELANDCVTQVQRLLTPH